MDTRSPTVVAAALAIASLDATPAHACSRVIAPALLTGLTAPADGATGVPLNARVLFATDGGFNGSEPIAAVIRQGAEVLDDVAFELTSAGILVSSGSLAPDTGYTVEVTVPGINDGSGGELTPQVVGVTLTTGSSNDGQAPAPADLSVETTANDGNPIWGYFDSCGPIPASTSVEVSATASDDDVAFFELVRVADDGSRVVVDAAANAPLTDVVISGDAARYEVVVVDFAGNETSQELDVPSTGGCAAFAPSDAGVVALSLLGLLRRRRHVTAPRR